MGNLDRRISGDKTPTDGGEGGGVKDGPTGQTAEKAPKKHDAVDNTVAKASDVVHPGGKVPSEKISKP